MTPNDDLSEVVREYFAERADARTTPAQLEAVLGRTAAMRPSPGWLVRLIRPVAFRGGDGAALASGAHLAERRERPFPGMLSPRARVPSLGWAVLVLAIVGLLVAAALIAGNSNHRPLLGEVPTNGITSSPTHNVSASPAAIVTAPSLLAGTPPPECNGIGPDSVVAASPGGTLAGPGPSRAGSPSNGLVAYATPTSIMTYDPGTRTTTQLASLSSANRYLAVGDLTWSPDGRRLAFAIGIGNSTVGPTADNFWCDLFVMNGDGSGLRALAPLYVGRDSVENILWSPDGRTIAYNANGYEDSVFVVTMGGSSRQLPGTIGCWSEAWSPDGTRIACGGSVVNVATGEFKNQNLIPNGGSPSSGPPAWAVGGQSFTALGQSNVDRVTAYRVAVDGTILSSIDLPGSSAWTPGTELSPDGSRVLARLCPVPCVNDVLYDIVPIDGSAVIPIGRGTDAVWSKDGSKVAMTLVDGLAVADASTGTTRPLVQATDISGVISWSPDQHDLLYTLDNGELWMVAATGGDATRIASGPLSTYWSAAWQSTFP
jgi:Tol biopolymer transport system component